MARQKKDREVHTRKQALSSMGSVRGGGSNAFTSPQEKSFTLEFYTSQTIHQAWGYYKDDFRPSKDGKTLPLMSLSWEVTWEWASKLESNYGPWSQETQARTPGPQTPGCLRRSEDEASDQPCSPPPFHTWKACARRVIFLQLLGLCPVP
jgi:hypothetical protein